MVRKFVMTALLVGGMLATGVGNNVYADGSQLGSGGRSDDSGFLGSGGGRSGEDTGILGSGGGRSGYIIATTNTQESSVADNRSGYIIATTKTEESFFNSILEFFL